jgi:hypothetical protein
MTTQLFRILLAREVRQEVEVAIWAENAEDAKWRAENETPQTARWRDAEVNTCAQAVSIQTDG